MSEAEFSCGGVVVDSTRSPPACLVIVPTRRAANGAKVVALPKGHPDGDETPEVAALREVREETGVAARVSTDLGDMSYHYQRSGRKIRKVVRFFLMEYTGGSTDDHDHEVEVVRWVALDEAIATLTYPGEREMVERARSELLTG